MSENEALGAVLDKFTSIFESRQFSRVKKNIWVSRTNELGRIVNLERSTLGQLYFSNFGISINALTIKSSSTNVAASDVYGRICGLVPGARPSLAELEFVNGDFYHFDKRLRFLRDEALPVLHSIVTVDDLKGFIRDCQPPNYLVRLEAVKYLKNYG
jgi:hypothetical protein